MATRPEVKAFHGDNDQTHEQNAPGNEPGLLVVPALPSSELHEPAIDINNMEKVKKMSHDDQGNALETHSGQNETTLLLPPSLERSSLKRSIPAGSPGCSDAAKNDVVEAPQLNLITGIRQLSSSGSTSSSESNQICR